MLKCDLSINDYSVSEIFHFHHFHNVKMNKVPIINIVNVKVRGRKHKNK